MARNEEPCTPVIGSCIEEGGVSSVVDVCTGAMTGENGVEEDKVEKAADAVVCVVRLDFIDNTSSTTDSTVGGGASLTAVA